MSKPLPELWTWYDTFMVGIITALLSGVIVGGTLLMLMLRPFR